MTDEIKRAFCPFCHCELELTEEEAQTEKAAFDASFKKELLPEGFEPVFILACDECVDKMASIGSILPLPSGGD